MTIPYYGKSFSLYEHHGNKVWVRSDLIGQHRDYCLCHQNCIHFKPNTKENCEIAQANYENCVTYKTVQPVWECPQFTSVKEDKNDK